MRNLGFTFRHGYTTKIEFQTARGLNRKAGHVASQKRLGGCGDRKMIKIRGLM